MGNNNNTLSSNELSVYVREKYSFSIHHESKKKICYRKYNSGVYVELNQVLPNIISIYLGSNDSRLVIANRYICETYDHVDFLLMNGRCKSIINPE